VSLSLRECNSAIRLEIEADDNADKSENKFELSVTFGPALLILIGFEEVNMPLR